MRILVIVSFYKPAYVYGGPVRSISAMCEALAGLGQEVTVLTTNANGVERLDLPLQKPVNVNGVEVVYYPVVPALPSNLFFSLALTRGFAQHVKMYDIAVLEVLFTHAMGPAVSACRKHHVPYIVPPRGQLLPWALNHKRLKKIIYMDLLGKRHLNQAAALHCTDPYEVNAIKKLKLRAPYFTIANGIDLAKFSHTAEVGFIRKKLNVPSDALLLVFLGRLHRKKRPDIAIQAFAKVLSVFPNAYLLMCGPDEEGMLTELKAHAQAIGCSEHVLFTGLIKGDEVQHVLADADLFIMPSEPQSENFGMSAVEALAAGVPILTSQGVPIGLWAEQYGAGHVVPSTADSFGEMAVKMLTDPSALAEMGRRGYDLVRQHFEIHILAQQMLAQYQSIVTTGKPLSEDGG